MKSSTTRALVAKKQSTSFTQVATNLLNVLQGYSKTIRLLLVMFLTLTVTTNAWGETATFTATQSGGWTTTAGAQSGTIDGVTLEVTNGIINGTTQLRCYSGATMTISSTNNITEITVTCTGSGTSDYSPGKFSLSNSTGSYTCSDVIGTWEGSATSVSLKASAQVRMTQIVVTYTAAASCTSINPSLSYTPSSLSVGGTANPTLTGNSGNGSVTYSSSNTSVATVNASTGVVTAKAAGTTTITATIAANNGYCEGTATANVTVTANPYTVTLNAGSGTCAASVTEASAGAGVTLPTPTLDGCDEWSFAGWKTTSAVTTETTTEPTLIPAGAYSPTSDITLYAVYQRTETTSGGGGGESHSITITPNTFTDKGSNNYGSGAERIGSENGVSFGGHYITGNVKNTPSGATAGTYLQCQANNATIYNKTELPGKITKIVVNQHEARAFSLYCGKEQLVASNNTNTGVTPSGTKIADTSSATTMTWNVSGDYTFFAIKKGSNAGYVTSIVITYQTDGGQSETTYYHSTPDCGSTEPSLCLIQKEVAY